MEQSIQPRKKERHILYVKMINITEKHSANCSQTTGEQLALSVANQSSEASFSLIQWA